MHRRDFVATTSRVALGSMLVHSTTAACASSAAHGKQAGPLDIAAFHRERRFLDTRFGRIAYIERGRGPAALFLHGLPLNGFQWRGALERLAGTRRCIAPDFMGLGYSEIPADQDLSPSAQTDMLVALLDALGIDTVDLVASDSGCCAAQLFVARHPGRARTLLLTNGDIHENSPPPTLEAAIALARAGKFVEEMLAPQLDDPALAAQPLGLGGLCYTDPAFVTPDLLEVYLRPLVSTEHRVQQLHAFWLALEPNPLLAIEPALRQSPVPVRVVWGTADHFFPAASAEWVDSAFPRSRGIRWVEGARLFFPEEMPDLIAEEARALWQGA